MITDFIGHLHPVLLHLPLGIFSVAFIAFYFHPDKAFRLSGQFNFILLISFICASISAISGWLLAHSGDYQQGAVSLHQWTAIVFTILCGCVYFLQSYNLSKNQEHRAFRFILIATFVLMMFTGHQGGSLTHGEGFLWPDDQLHTASNVADINDKITETESTPIKKGEKTNGSLPSVEPPDSLTVKKLQESGFMVKPVSTGSGWLEISAVSMPKLEHEQLQKLISLAKNIYGLNLSNHPLNDDDVQVLKELENLKRLDVRNTGLTDHFLENITGLTNLAYINLVGTNLSDQGLENLESMKGLRKVYCWKTAVTEKGKLLMNKKRPDIEVIMGFQ